MLTQEQEAILRGRIDDPVHKFDHGPTTVWNTYSHSPQKFHVFVLKKSGDLVGITFFSGPLQCADAGWWIDSIHRGQHYGNEMVDRLAEELKRLGFYDVGEILVSTFADKWHAQSSTLRKRFRAHFDRTD